MDKNALPDITPQIFFTSMFPNVCEKIIEEMIKEEKGDIDKILNRLLHHWDQEEEDTELCEFDVQLKLLVEMFPAIEEGKLYNCWLDSGEDMEKVVEAFISSSSSKEDKKGLIILPKSKKNLRHTPQAKKVISQLEETFPQFDGVAEVLAEVEGDLNRAAHILSEMTKITDEENVRARDSKALEELRSIFPQIDSGFLVRTLGKNSGNIQDATLEVLTLMDGPANDSVWQTPLISPEPPIEVKFADKDKRQEEYTTPLCEQYPGLDSSQLRDRASNLSQERSRLFNLAAKNFKQGKITGRSTASYYADEGRKMTEEINKLNAAACAKRLAHNFKLHDEDLSVIDLHGLFISEAVSAVLAKCVSWRKELRIIVGAGHHSNGGVSRLRPVIYKLLKGLHPPWIIEEERSGPGFFMARPP